MFAFFRRVDAWIGELPASLIVLGLLMLFSVGMLALVLVTNQ